MKLFTTTAAAALLAASATVAGSMKTEDTSAEIKSDMNSAAQSVENAAESTAAAAQDAANAAEETVSDAWDATKETANEAKESVENAYHQAANETRETVTNASYASEEMDNADLIRSRDITGGTVYSKAANAESWDTSMTYDAVNSDWNNIGEIEDIVFSKDGEIKGIVAEIGGFLDIGDKHVMISVEDMNLVAVDDKSFSFVTRLTEEELEQLPAVDEGFWN